MHVDAALNWVECSEPDVRGWRVVCCAQCGFRLNPTPSPLSRIVGECPRCRNKNEPTPPRKLLNFSLASIKHVAAGAPTCTQEQIDERIVVCYACPLYVPTKDNPEVGHCSHEKCGCTVTREQKFISKLAWRDQECPLGKWPKLIGKEVSP